MPTALYLTLRRVAHRPLAPILLVASLALSILLPLATRSIIARFELALTARADATPLIAGSAGSALDLVLSGLYFRADRIDPVPAALWDELAEAGDGVAVPVLTGPAVRGEPLVGTSIEYFERRGLVCVEGALPLLPGEIVLGAEVAHRLDLTVGAKLFSDQSELYDLSVPQALELLVVGVLAPVGGPDDRAAFTDVVTAWAIAGLAHGHTEAGEVTDPELILAELEGTRILSPALRTSNDPVGDGLADFHVHGERETLPLSAVLFFPDDDKAATLTRARVDERPERIMVAPRAVVDELLGLVFRVRRVLDLFAGLLALTTLVLGALVMALSTRLRAEELTTLDALGASRSLARGTIAVEIALELALAAALALAALGLLLALLPEPARWLG